MKQAFMLLSVLSLGVAQTSGAVEANFQPYISNNAGISISNASRSYTSPGFSSTPTYSSNFSSTNYATVNNTRVSSDDEISQAIASLSARAQQKEDQLASLAERLSEKQNLQAGILDSSAAPAIAAARASRAAHSRSTGRCALYVRRALQAAGYSFTPNPSAYQYATRGTLAGAGFVKINNNLPPQVGDVIVYNRSGRHPHGHIQIFDGQNWVSDFRQKDISPYSGSYAYTTWRDARYHNDASDRGIYLAMSE